MTASEEDAATALRQAVTVTRAQGSARVLHIRTVDVETPQALLGRRGPLKWFLRRFLDAARYREAEGVIEFEPLRLAVDHGAFARSEIGPQRWAGRSGRSLSTLPVDDSGNLPALWLWDALDQVATVSDDAEEEIRGTTCRRLVAALDLDRAAGASDHLTRWQPSGDESFETDPPQLQVWVGRQYVWRIRLTTRLGAQSTNSAHTVELWDFGVDTALLDWARLSTFRTEHEPKANRV